jgi:23S rRNA (uracil1939-C5)-methyltransferase
VSRRRHAPLQEFEAGIVGLTHDGRGVARTDGKAVFVRGALPGERVRARQTARHRHYDEANTLEVLQASPDRVEPRCAHFGTCAGCVLQHLDPARQIEAKQDVLLENLDRIGHVKPGRVLPALADSAWGYRRKGRLSVRFVEKKGRTLVGFREIDPRFVAEIKHCDTVIPAVGGRIGEIAELIDTLEAKRDIPQIEFIAGDDGAGGDAVALVVRHLQPLGEADRDALVAFAKRTGLAMLLQPGGVESVQPLWPESIALSFSLPQHDVTLGFQPLDFIQVNAGMNARMIERALELLQPDPAQRVLDLFCGLGNFTLPIARQAGHVVGVEGDAGLVARARENAIRNGIANAEFFAADLTGDLKGEPWLAQRYDAMLLDPPRSGAIEVLRQWPKSMPPRIVYVSCHPGSLARDAEYLVSARGYLLKAAGVMDMFPHTAHVESIALFEQR